MHELAIINANTNNNIRFCVNREYLQLENHTSKNLRIEWLQDGEDMIIKIKNFGKEIESGNIDLMKTV